MASLYNLLQNMNPELNQRQMTLKDLIAQAEQKKRDDLIAKQTQSQIQNPVSQETLTQNIPQQANVMPNQDQLSQPQTLADRLGINIKDVLANQPKVTPEQEAYQTPPKPYSIADFGKYTKSGKGFLGKVGHGLVDVLAALGTPEGMKIGGALSYGLGGNIYNAKAMTDQGDIIASQNMQKQKQYDEYIKDLRKTSTEYDMKLLDILGKDAFNALKGGKGLILIDKTNGKAYLPVTQEDGTIKNKEINPDEYTRKGYEKVDLFKPQIDQVAQYQEKQDIRNKAAIERAKALSPIQTQTALNTKMGQEELELAYLPKKQELQNKAAIEKEAGMRESKLTGLQPAIQVFEEGLKDLPVGTGIGGKLQGKSLEIAGRLGLNAKAAGYTALMEGMRSQIARGLGEVGNLAENEQKYAMSLLPQLSDNTETRMQKLNNFKKYIRLKKEQGSGMKNQKQTSVGKYEIVGVE